LNLPCRLQRQRLLQQQHLERQHQHDRDEYEVMDKGGKGIHGDAPCCDLSEILDLALSNSASLQKSGYVTQLEMRCLLNDSAKRRNFQEE
jgi:hypothetical protein